MIGLFNVYNFFKIDFLINTCQSEGIRNNNEVELNEINHKFKELSFQREIRRAYKDRMKRIENGLLHKNHQNQTPVIKNVKIIEDKDWEKSSISIVKITYKKKCRYGYNKPNPDEPDIKCNPEDWEKRKHDMHIKLHSHYCNISKEPFSEIFLNKENETSFTSHIQYDHQVIPSNLTSDEVQNKLLELKQQDIIKNDLNIKINSLKIRINNAEKNYKGKWVDFSNSEKELYTEHWNDDKFYHTLNSKKWNLEDIEKPKFSFLRALHNYNLSPCIETNMILSNTIQEIDVNVLNSIINSLDFHEKKYLDIKKIIINNIKNRINFDHSMLTFKEYDIIFCTTNPTTTNSSSLLKKTNSTKTDSSKKANEEERIDYTRYNSALIKVKIINNKLNDKLESLNKNFKSLEESYNKHKRPHLGSKSEREQKIRDLDEEIKNKRKEAKSLCKKEFYYNLSKDFDSIANDFLEFLTEDELIDLRLRLLRKIDPLDRLTVDFLERHMRNYSINF